MNLAIPPGLSVIRCNGESIWFDDDLCVTVVKSGPGVVTLVAAYRGTVGRPVVVARFGCFELFGVAVYVMAAANNRCKLRCVCSKSIKIMREELKR